MSRIVTLNWTELETAFERNAPGIESYLDLSTGDVFSVVDGHLEAADRRARIMQEPGRFVRVEPASSREQYRWMERFVSSVSEASLRERLLIAIDGKGAFRRFKDVLYNYPAERERWFSFRADLLHCRMHAWLLQAEIEARNPAPWGDVAPPPETPPAASRSAEATGESPGETLRRRTKEIVDQIATVELPSAIAFLEFLQQRGAPALLGETPAGRAATVPGAEVSEGRAAGSGATGETESVEDEGSGGTSPGSAPQTADDEGLE